MATAKTPAAASIKKTPGKPRNVRNVIPVATGNVAVYASPKISKALSEVTAEMTLYHGVRLNQIFEAIYNQGKKDGARDAFAELDKKVKEAQKAIPHRNPGKPKKVK